VKQPLLPHCAIGRASIHLRTVVTSVRTPVSDRVGIVRLANLLIAIGTLFFPWLAAISSVAAEPDRPAPTFTPDDAGFREHLVPFLKSHCLRCHGPAKQEGEFRVDRQLKTNFLDPTVKEKWGEVVNVLNSHEMPPEKEPQPATDDVARVVDWITQQMTKAELVRRDQVVVLRRLNREEYRNTIRDLVGVDFDPAGFPQDPPAGGFDNNGKALTLSPLHTELYLEAARRILDRALVEGEQPPAIKWRFEPETGSSDSNRVRYGRNNAIVNGGNNPVRDGFKVLHHESWDKHLNARDFKVEHAGEYIVRIRAAGRVPSRDEVVESARKALAHRRDEQIGKNPQGKKWHDEQFERDLAHFRADRMYDYGPPRLKLIQALGGQPRTIAEFDVPAPVEKPGVYEIRTLMTTESAGFTVEYAYSIPKVLENFWFQSHDVFARPELFVDWFEIEGPLVDSWPPSSHRKILFDSPLANADERAYARVVLARFMRRAYRRPIADAEVDDKLRLFDQVRAESPSFVQAIKTPLTAVLVSPFFLYLTEPAVGDSNNSPSVAASLSAPSERSVSGDNVKSSGPRRLNDHELASRLSFFLWSTMPDDPLAQAADEGRLGKPAELAKQVERLLADPRSEALERNFASQWLGLREVGANPPAADLYPQYDRHLEVSMVGESLAFFREILRHDLNVMNFVGSDFVVINERLARYYGIDGVRGDEFRRVAVPTSVHRGGLVTQASILTITSNGTRTSPVKRGVWVMRNLLGTDPGLPVANAGDIAPKVPGIDKATVRKRLEIHRELPQCARCHSKIDPLGFALENYNAAGQWRDQEGFGYKGRIERNDPVIDASSKLPDGTAINGVDSLRTELRAREDLFLNNLASKLLTYALGRELGVADQPTVKAAVAHCKKNQYTLRSLIHFIAASEAFGTK
jgi:mono/diheme cytochrome c family protein